MYIELAIELSLPTLYITGHLQQASVDWCFRAVSIEPVTSTVKHHYHNQHVGARSGHPSGSRPAGDGHQALPDEEKGHQGYESSWRLYV